MHYAPSPLFRRRQPLPHRSDRKRVAPRTACPTDVSCGFRPKSFVPEPASPGFYKCNFKTGPVLHHAPPVTHAVLGYVFVRFDCGAHTPALLGITRLADCFHKCNFDTGNVLHHAPPVARVVLCYVLARLQVHFNTGNELHFAPPVVSCFVLARGNVMHHAPPPLFRYHTDLTGYVLHHAPPARRL
jgi:hypothetical protein